MPHPAKKVTIIHKLVTNLVEEDFNMVYEAEIQYKHTQANVFHI